MSIQPVLEPVKAQL